MQFRTLIPIVLAAPLLGSCVGLVVGAAAAYGYVQYEENEAWADFDASLVDTWDASLATLEANGFEIDAAPALAQTEGEIDGPEIHLSVERYPEDFTRVRVRVGTFDTADNRRKAMLVLEEIGDRLD